MLSLSYWLISAHLITVRIHTHPIVLLAQHLMNPRLVWDPQCLCICYNYSLIIMGGGYYNTTIPSVNQQLAILPMHEACSLFYPLHLPHICGQHTMDYILKQWSINCNVPLPIKCSLTMPAIPWHFDIRINHTHTFSMHHNLTPPASHTVS